MTPAASSGDSAWACMALVAAAGTVACGPLAGQAAPWLRDAAAPGVVTVTAGTQYRAGWLHRALLGAHYRELWATPIQVEVLDLSRFGGGLTPVKRGGGRQTKSLRLHAADGRVYVFRSVDKDVAAAMPPELRATFVQQILQDQISASHPAGALVVGPLLSAAGVSHAEPALFVMPDDARLDSFPEFKRMLGQVEERPTVDPEEDVGFEGAEKIVGTAKLWDRLTRDSRDRVDSRAFLAARLMDVFVGDWDRHPDQWRWARFDEGDVRVWRPIPRDRDQAFSRLDGFLPWLARYYHPDVVSFGRSYPDMVGLNWDARALDRRLHTDLEKPVWDSAAAALQARLTDSVIDAAVARLPAEYYERSGPELARALKRRRDRLGEAAGRFYALLARDVDVHATDQAELAELDRHADGTVTLRLSRRDPGSGGGAARGAPYYQRTFRSSETGELRVYLQGGDDRTVVRGAGCRITVRVIGGGQGDELVDSSRAGVRFYRDSSGSRLDPLRAPPRDWGSRWNPLVRVLFARDLGLVVGAGETVTGYGFRRAPYASRQTLWVNFATAPQRFRVDYAGDFRGVGLGLDATLAA